MHRLDKLWIHRAAAVVLAGLWWSGPAAAQDSGDTATARALGVDGVKLANAGNCAEAVDKLARSEALHHAVIVLERLGECQLATGKIVDGSESLRRVLREPVPPNAPPSFAALRDQAEKALAGAAHRIARVNIAVSAPPGAAIWVKMDGRSIPTASLNTERPVDPGDHIIEAGAPGFVGGATKVHSGDGASDSVTLTLTEEPHAVVAQVVAAPPVVVPPVAPSAVDRPAEARRSHTAAYVVGGIGVAGLLVGIGGGVAALVDKGNLTSACHGTACPPTSSSTLKSGEAAGTASTIGFVVGAVGLAGGVALYFIDFGGHGESDHARARLFVGPGNAGLSGSF